MDVDALSQKIREVTPFIAHLDIQVTRGADEDYTEIQMPIKPEFSQHLGHAHGGVIGAMADIAANLNSKQPMVTVEYKINFLRPAQGDKLIARSRRIREGSRFTVAQAEVYAVQKQQEVLLATCLATPVLAAKA